MNHLVPMTAISLVLAAVGSGAGGDEVVPPATKAGGSGADDHRQADDATRAADEWGVASNGLVASLRAAKAVFAAHEPMTFLIRVKNISSHEIVITGLGSELSAHSFDFRFGKREWRQNQPQLVRTPLKPGETKTVTVKVAAADQAAFALAGDADPKGERRERLPEGEHEVCAAFMSPSGSRDHPNAVETNRIRIRIGKPPPSQPK